VVRLKLTRRANGRTASGDVNKAEEAALSALGPSADDGGPVNSRGRSGAQAVEASKPRATALAAPPLSLSLSACNSSAAKRSLRRSCN
jgi:hypothetical protein